GGNGGYGGVSPDPGEGGAICISETPTTIDGSSFYGNTSGNGGLTGAGGTGGPGGTGSDGDPGAPGGNGGAGGGAGMPYSGGGGGAISSNSSALTIDDSLFAGNGTGNGGGNGRPGIGGAGGTGGAANIDGADGGNGGNGGAGGFGSPGSSGGAGGAIHHKISTLTIRNSTFHDNFTGSGMIGSGSGPGGAGGSGGYGYDYGGNGGTGGAAGSFPGSGGNGGNGGALSLETDDAVTLTNVTFSSNGTGSSRSGGNGGNGGVGGAGGPGGNHTGQGGDGGHAASGAGAGGTGNGGAISLPSSGYTVPLSINYNTIVSNALPAAYGSGGLAGINGNGGLGIPNGAAGDANVYPGGPPSVGYGGGIYKQPGSVTLIASILAGNTAVHGPDCLGNNFTSSGWNVIGNDTECTITSGAGDLIDGAAIPLNLGPLASNGSTIMTHAVLPDSVALNHVPSGSAGCGSTVKMDARGIWRPINGYCEVGAYELGSMGFLPLLKK
ncbi:MAG: choice-of-anchor Q domain-containing protein, partial [Anaerolineaceae bacterium]